MTGTHDEGRGGRGPPPPPAPSGPPDGEADARWRSLLFFPGTRPDRYAKALASGADLVCVDLEDAVGPTEKASARANLAGLLGRADWVPDRSAVRLNAVTSEDGRHDLQMLIETAGRAARSGQGEEGGAAPDPGWVLLLPKVEGAREVEDVGARLSEAGADVRIVAMIETARGLEEAPYLACAPRVTALFLGAVDLAAELGCALEWDALLYARSRVVHASALGGVGSIDVPFLDLHDLAGLDEEVRAVARLGFTAKAAIHPSQIDIIHGAFAPTRLELERARRILDANERSEGGVTVLDGRMIDRPVVEAARRTLARERKSDP